MPEPGAYDAGAVQARLGALFTGRDEFAKFDRALEAAERRKKVEAELGAKVDERAFRAFERELERAESRAKRRDAYKVALGAEWTPQASRAFNSAERAMRDYERQSDRVGASNKKLDVGLLNLSSRLPLVKWGAFAAGAAAAVPPVVALGGALGPIIGLLGAIPGLAATAGGALTTGLLGLRGVGDAVGAAWEGQLTAADDATAASQKAVTSVEAIRGAEERLGDAHKGAREAQDDLNEAREEAVRRLEDMRVEAERASVAEKGTALALREARQELARLESEGVRGLELADARQRVREAELDLSDVRRDAARNAEDLAEVERTGVRGMPEMVAARERVTEANRGVRRAANDVALAERDAAAGMAEATGGAQKLEEKLADLSPAGREFVQLISTRFFPLFRQLRDEAQEGLLPGLGRGLVEAERNFPVLERMVGRYGDALGDAAEQHGRLFGSRAQGRDFELIFAQGEQLIRDSADASLDWARGLTHVAVAADPLLEWAGEMNMELAAMFEEWAKGGRESGRLERFFERATRKTELTVEALWDFGRGLINIGAIGARVWGDDMLRGINDVAERFRDWTESVKGERAIENYFERWREIWRGIAGEIKNVIGRYKELRAEGKSATEALATVLAEALGDALVALAEQAGRLAPKVVAGFVKGFLEADAWGKLAMTGWLIAKFGGMGAVRGIGSRIAGALFGGMGTPGAGFAGAAGEGGVLRRLFGAKPVPVFVTNPGFGGPGKPGKPDLPNKDPFRNVPGPLKAIPPLAAAYGQFKLFQEVFEGHKPGSLSQFTQVAPMRRVLGSPMRNLGERPDEGVTASAVRQGRVADQVRRNIRQLRVEGARDLGSLARTTERNLKVIEREFGSRSASGRRLLVENFQASSRAVIRLMRGGRLSTRDGMRAIETLMKAHSSGGKEGLRKNYGAAIEIVRRTMRRGGEITEKGMAIIRGLMVEQLKLYGINPKKALRIANLGGTTDDSFREAGHGPPPVAKAGGGWVGRIGERGRDMVHAILGRGEAVLNFVQQRVVNAGLAKLGIRGLPELFRRTRGTKHHMAEGGIAGDGASIASYFPFAGRFAPGGIVGVPGFPGESAATEILDEIAWVRKNYPGLILTDAYGPGHQSATHTVTGTAADFSGPDAQMDAAVKRLVAMGYKVGYDGRFGSEAWPGHGPSYVTDNFHFHVEFGGPGEIGGAAGGALAKLKRVVVGGPDSPLKAIVQRALDTVRGGAQERLNSAIAATGVGGSWAGVGQGEGQATRAQMVRWATTALHRTGHGASPEAIDKILDLAMKESSWIVDSINLWDSNAAAGNPSGGLMHVTADKVGGSWPSNKARLFDPVLNMIASINYQFGRYGGLVTHSPYAAGGVVGGDGASIASFMGLPSAGGFDVGGYVGGSPTKAEINAFVGRGGKSTAEGRGFRSETRGIISMLRERIEGRQTDYSNWSQRFDLSDEELINEGDENTPPSLNQDAIARKAGELQKLVSIQQSIVDDYQRLVFYIRRLLRVYEAMKRRLEVSVDRARKSLSSLDGRKGKKKRRDAIQGRLDDYLGALKDARSNVTTLSGDLVTEQDNLFGARTDLMRDQQELGALSGVQLPEWEPPGGDDLGGGGDADVQAQLDQANQKVAALEEFRRSSQSAFSVFQGPGDIGAGAVSAHEAARNPYGPGPAGPGLGLELRDDGRVYPIGGGSPVSDPFAGGGAGGGGGVSIVQNFHSPIPATSAQLDQIGRAATAGISGQGARIAPREKVSV